MRRGRFLTSVAAIAALGLVAAACGSDDSSDDTTAAPAETTAAAADTTAGSTETTAGSTATTAGGEDMTCTPEADVAKVGIVYDITGRGDKSFNDAAAAGLDKRPKHATSSSRSRPRPATATAPSASTSWPRTATVS